MTIIRYHDEAHIKRRDYMREYNQRPGVREKHLARMRRWSKKNPGKKRAANASWRDANREQHRGNARRWAEENPEKYRYNMKMASRKRRAIKRGLLQHHSRAEWENLLNKYDRRCIACGATDKIEADHVVPIAQGGTDDIGNIQPLCRSCNARKWSVEHDWRI